MMNNSCPYCGVALADSKDHIFPQFLGGRKTIEACTRCNSTFGSKFEAAVKANLEPIMVGLAICGFKPTTRVRWKKARTDPATGWDYDLNPSGELSLSHDQVERDAEGGISRIVMRDDPKQAQKHAASLIDKGLASEVQQTVSREPFNGSLPLHLHIGEEARRLAVKMCAALARLDLAGGRLDVLDATARTYLLQGESSPLSIPVKMAFLRYGALDKLRPPLSHVVYVEVDTVARRCYGVVQFFGVIQLYVVLNAQYSDKDFARVGFVNRHIGVEHFEAVKPLNLSEAPDTLFKDELVYNEQNWFAKIDREVHALFGSNLLLFGMQDRSQVSA